MRFQSEVYYHGRKVSRPLLRPVGHIVTLAETDNIGPPCAPWCTIQPGGPRRRSVVHNIVLYPRGGAQHRSHKPRQTDKK